MTTYSNVKDVVDFDVELERNLSDDTPPTVDGVPIRDDEFVLRRRIGSPFCSRYFDPLPNSLVGSEIFVTEKGESFFFKRKEKPIYYIDHSIGYKESDPVSLEVFDSSLTGSIVWWDYNIFDFLDFFDVPICHDYKHNPCCLDKYYPGSSEGFDLKQYVREVGGVNIGESGEALKSTHEFEFKIPYVYIEQGSSFNSFEDLVSAVKFFNFPEDSEGQYKYRPIVREYLYSYVVLTGNGGYFADRVSVFFDKDTFGRIPMKKAWEDEGFLYNLCYVINQLNWYIGEFTITCEESGKTEKYKTDRNSHLNFIGKDRTIHEIKGNYEDVSVSYRRGSCFATDGSSIDIYIGNEQRGHVEGNGQSVIKDGVAEETDIGKITSVFACYPSTSQEDIVGYFVGDVNGEKTLYSVSDGNVYVVFSERGQEEKIELFQKFYDDAFHGILVTSKGSLKNIYEVKGKISLALLFSKEDFETGGWIRYEFLSENFIKEKNELSQIDYFGDECVGRKSVVSLFGYDGEFKDEKEFENIVASSDAIVCGEMKNGTAYIGDTNQGMDPSVYIIEKGSDTLKEIETGIYCCFGFFHDDVDGKLYLAGFNEDFENCLFSVNIENYELEEEVRYSNWAASYGVAKQDCCRSGMFFGKGNGVGFSVGEGISINGECLGVVVPVERSSNGGFYDEFIKMVGVLRPAIYENEPDARQYDFSRPVESSVEVVDGIAYETYRLDMKLSNPNFYQYDHDLKQGNVPVIGKGEFP